MSLKEQVDYWNKTFLDSMINNDVCIHGEMNYRTLKIDSGKVLDVACGDLKYLNYTKRPEDTYLVGLDFCKLALKLAKRRIKIKDKVDIDLVRGTAQNLPFRENAFDEVLCIELIHSTGNDYQQILKGLSRSSNSNVILTLHHKEFGEGDETLFDEGEAEKVLGEANLRIDKMKTLKSIDIFDVPHNKPWPSDLPPKDAKTVMQIEASKIGKS